MSTPTKPNRIRPKRSASERAEGVISTAIAVLVIAFLGVAMWVGFKSIFDDAATNTRTQVESIGR
jgi:TRAP-type C4-dicarboxylate transport system permease small subunit